jgi:hypothetical protein
MSYEVYNTYRREPGYFNFLKKLNRIVNRMKELKNWNNNLYITNQLSNNAYMKYLDLRQKGLKNIYALEKQYGFYSDGAFTEGYY